MANGDLNQYKLNGTYSQKKTLLDQERAQSNRALEAQKNQEQQAAAIGYQKLMKYLPEYQKSMGLKGNGMSETAMLDAAARYRSEQGRIASEYASRQDSVNSQYRQNLLDLYSQAEEQEKQDREDRYNKAKEAIQNWNGSAEDLTKYIESLSGQVDDGDYAILKDVYSGMNKSIVAEENAKKLEEAKNAIQVDDLGDKKLSNTVPEEYAKGHNFKITLEDQSYKVQVGDKISNTDLRMAATNSGVVEGDVFVYQGKVYLKGADGIYKIEKRALQGNTSNDYNDMIAALTGQAAPTSTAPVQASNSYTGAETVFPTGAMR